MTMNLRFSILYLYFTPMTNTFRFTVLNIEDHCYWNCDNIIQTYYKLICFLSCQIESEQDRAQVFLSYQWDSQDEVKVMRDKLERSGFMCWMDIGQLGGGDQLYTKIDEALRHCKVM